MRPQKKKDSSNSYKSMSELQAAHELFLQAFEKPTQIYRYLRTRNLISPIFLQRNLYYMKGRMSRNHKTRQSFKVDSLVKRLENQGNNGNSLPGAFLNISFNSFTDCKLDSLSGEFAKVETHIVKISHKKRKESSAPLTQVVVGNCDVNINADCDKSNLCTNPSLISIPTSHFTTINGSQVKSYMLVFRVSLLHDQENGEPIPKRRRISRNGANENHHENCHINGSVNSHTESNNYIAINGDTSTCFGAELVVYDRFSRCQLAAGQYELIAQPLGGLAVPIKSSPKKNIFWESIEDVKMEGPFLSLQELPVLKFDLSWTEETLRTSGKSKSKQCQPLDIALANNIAAKPRPPGVASPEAPQLVLYQFVYNNNSRQQTESRRDFHCPWCSINCCALYSLLKHLKLCHARFSFTYVPHPKGARIDVALNECFDGSYSGNPQDLVAMPTGYAFTRCGPTRRTANTSILVCMPKRTKPSLSEFLEQDDNDFDIPRSYILGHNRLYHHTMVCLPVQPHELDVDSEGEHDSDWVRTKTRMMIDEFSDVNEGEKELMKMWNLHVMKYNFVGDCQLPLALHMFVETHAADLLQRNLYKNFILHMVSLHDFGLIGAGAVYKSITRIKKILNNEPVGKSLQNIWAENTEKAKRPFLGLSPKRTFSANKESKLITKKEDTASCS